MNILVTGGAGYIGSHTLIELIAEGHSVVVVDNLSNSYSESLRRVECITGQALPFYKVDIRDREGLDRVFALHRFDCCIHFAGLKAMRESVVKPWEYYENNVYGTLVLLDVMRRHGCKNIIFSSSATVYGNPAQVPITEACPKGHCTNPYGQTKSMLEEILIDLHTADVKMMELHAAAAKAGACAQADAGAGDGNAEAAAGVQTAGSGTCTKEAAEVVAFKPWNVVVLRYFNPIGAHESGLIGEDPNGIPNNLMPYITHVAVGELDELHVFGDDYDTSDGTGVRDYIHVVDLAKGHVKALKAIEENCGVAIYNLGTGRGYSVLEVVNAFEQVSGVTIPYVIEDRRPGDIAVCYSDPGKAKRELGWKAERDIYDMCRDSWNWQKKNPEGYGG